MRLVVCGNTTAYLAPFSAGTSYVVETGGERIVVDAGQGTLARIGMALEGGAPMDAVVLTHLHFDHITDLPPLLKVAQKGMPVIAPPRARRSLDALAEAYAFDGPFDLPGPLVEAAAGHAVQLGKARLRFAPLRHSAPGVSVAIEADGRRIVIASDTAPTPELVRLAQGADLLVCHTLLASVDPESDHARVHTTARAAGDLAAAAGVADLLLSHIYFESKPEEMRREALRSARRVEIAETGRTYMLE